MPVAELLGSGLSPFLPAAPALGEQRELTPHCHELAALRGEGVLRTRFFTQFMGKLRATLDAGQQITLWRELVEDGGLITAWVQRLGVAQALRREAVVPLDAASESRKLYNSLLDALADQAPQSG